MDIQINKEDTYSILFLNQQLYHHKKQQKYISLFETHCLHCKRKIYISYKQISPINIFCEIHKYRAKQINIVQLQYVRIIKEKQLKQIEQFFK